MKGAETECVLVPFVFMKKVLIIDIKWIKFTIIGKKQIAHKRGNDYGT